jgi:hypothetical protein
VACFVARLLFALIAQVINFTIDTTESQASDLIVAVRTLEEAMAHLALSKNECSGIQA